MILVLEDGNIAQQGTHQELMRQPGRYRQMYEAQATQSEAELTR
jgi:ABC-type multidrug transport system fused ATPase/permease subunit